MRFLTLTVLVSLIAPGPSMAVPPESSKIPPMQLERITELLVKSDRAYWAGEVKTGSERAKEALRLAASLEPELLHPIGSLNEKKERAILLLELGCAARSEGQPALAKHYLETSLKLFQETSGHQEPKVADVLMKLADIHLAEGHRELWQSLLDQALEIRLDVYGPHHPDVAYVWSLLGTQTEADGDLAAAEAYFRKALTSLQNSQPPTDQDLGFAYLE